ncbi:small ribosomal subunit protein mS31 [Planococcus citri]|uniref:small ribosomal subunit protein mS31 n=1 Tax=Planococcus citri TaxID=170843 RepID=UPI0031F92099
MIIRGFRINSIALKQLISRRAIFTSNRLLDESSSDEENDKPKRKPDKDEAVKKLNDLILLMAKKEPPSKLASQVKIPKPRENSRKIGLEMKKQKELEAEQMENEKLGNKLADAATKVAESYGGDTKKTEMELLDLYFSRRGKPSSTGEQSESSSEKNLLNNMLSEMKVEEESDSSLDRSEQMSSRAHQVRSMANENKPRQFRWGTRNESSKIKVEEENDSSLDKSEQESDPSLDESKQMPIRAHALRSMANENKPKEFRRFTRKADQPKANLFGEQPFKYFDVDKIKAQNVTPVSLTTWDYLYERDLKLHVTHPPKNIFEQLIQWTEQGKVWRFPIDNEQDWFEEQKYDFSDHVFLERWLEPWCPETGPVRDFMQLVCLGLSKNPYLTVPEKQAHIFWYEHYFRSKKKLLIDTGSGEIKDRPPVESRST